MVIGPLATDSFRGEVVAFARARDGFNVQARNHIAIAIDGLCSDLEAVE